MLANRDWPDAYGGSLELWPSDMSALGRRVFPRFNTTIVWETHDACYYGFDLARGERTEAGREESKALSVMLDSEAFLSVPLVYRERATGRLSAFLLEGWPQLEAAEADLLAETVVRLAISHASLPSAPASEAGPALATLLGPYVERVLDR